MSSREPTVRVVNAQGSSPFVLVCDHASRHLPDRYGTLGLDTAALASHIAWDPGALALCERLSALLDAPLVAGAVSRLVIDCNRALDAPNLIWTLSEDTAIPGNAALSEEERAHRVETVHAPFHAAVEALLDAREGRETRLVCIHSFTPVYRGFERPWVAGIIPPEDETFARDVRTWLVATGDAIGWNEPYSAEDGVTYTLERHGASRGLPSAMVEVRNDVIADEAGVDLWTGRLAGALAAARGSLTGEALEDAGHG